MTKLAKPKNAKDASPLIFCWQFSIGGKVVPNREES